MAASVASLTLGRYSQLSTGHFASTGSVAESITNRGLMRLFDLEMSKHNVKPEYGNELAMWAILRQSVYMRVIQ